MIKIAYVHGNSNVIAGQEIVLINIINGLNRNKFESIVILPKEGIFADILRKNKIRVHFADLSRFRFKNPTAYLKTVFKLYFFFKKEAIKIIHISGLYPNQYCIIAAKLLKIPCICHIHTTFYSKKDIDSSLLKYSELVIAVSNGVKEVIKNAHIKDDKIRVVYNGLDHNRYNVNLVKVGEIRKSLGIPDNYKIIGQVGQIIERKGISYFLQMAEFIVKQRNDVRFLLVGDDKYEPGYVKKMQELSRELNLSEFVIFTGFSDEIPELVALMDITVLNALQEGLGMVLIEAALLNKPVVCTDIPGCNEVIENNITGILVPPRDYKAMAEQVLILLGNNNLKERLIKNSKEKMLSTFSLNQQVKEISDIYEQFIKGR